MTALVKPRIGPLEVLEVTENGDSKSQSHIESPDGTECGVSTIWLNYDYEGNELTVDVWLFRLEGHVGQ